MNSNPGYIALVSAVIVSVLLLVITFSLSFSGFFIRFNILDHEFKEKSTALAEACAETAILKLATENPPYTGGETMNVGSYHCSVLPIEHPSDYVIKVQAIYPETGLRRSYSNVQVTVDDTDFSVNSWEEYPAF